MSDMESNAQALPSEELLSPSEFAAAIGKTERQVYRYIKQARLRTADSNLTGVLGVRIPASEVQRFQRPPIARTKIIQVQGSSEESDMTSDRRSLTCQSVPPERHEAAVLRIGYLERELEQAKRMLGDGGSEAAALKDRLEIAREQEIQLRVRAELEQQFREKAEKRVEDLTAQLAVAEEKLRRPWWKLW